MVVRPILAEDLIDGDVIAELKRIGNHGHLFSRVTALFFKNVPAALIEIERHATQRDVQGLANSVHALKSMCASLGARRAAKSCHELEILARTGQQFNAEAMVGAIKTQAHASMDRLRAIAQT
jgi:HPt (histidine-containing phosphotransfer) domain-containing protein